MPSDTYSRLRKGFAVQIRVIHALMIRELITRFGRDNIGFLWIMVEPLLFAVLVAIIWHYLHGETEHGIGITAFIVSGYIPLTLFRHAVARSVAAFTANGSLLYHRQVKILDFIVVRFVIEMIGGMMAYLFIGCVLVALGEFPVPDNIGRLIGGWCIYALFCFSLCLIIAPVSEMSEVLEKFVPVTTYIMIPFSGLFTMATWLTPNLREYFLYSPFVNGMEMMRKGIWGEKLDAYYDPWYTIWLSLALILIGLTLCRIVRRKLTVE